MGTLRANLVLSDDRIALHPLSLAHVHTHFRWNNDEELNRLDSEAPFEHESFGAFLRRFEAMVERPPAGTLDLEIHTRDGSLVGVAYVDHLCASNRHARVGVTIGDRHRWRQGFGSAALRLLLHHLFGERGLHRVTAQVVGFNEGGHRLVQRLGFTEEGRIRDHLHRDGRFWDQHLYGLLRSEFDAAEAASWVRAAAA
ncbi:MAG: GNAT family protein [Bacteroidota bacterium]